jgi:hypothetical protein
MKIVNIIGGLGNQMWQYAMLVALKKKFPEEEVFYNASFFNGYPLHNGFELDRIFNITAKQASVQDLRKVYHLFVNHYFFMKVYTHYFPQMKSEIREKRVSPYNKEFLERKGSVYYNGYWADHRYYDNCRDILLKEFSLKTPLDQNNLNFINDMKKEYTCSIHVRRGDYLNSPDYKGICGLDYYQKAIDVVRSKTSSRIVFLVFSNDINWCRENLTPCFLDNRVVFVDWNTGKDSYKDMYLMSRCNVNIIANSSFSWWAAYLNETPDKIIVSPEKYKNEDMGFKVPLNEWICI